MNRWLIGVVNFWIFGVYFSSQDGNIVPDLSHDYCVVGAGPSGLQMGYFLEKMGRDYVIFEQNSVPGSFFEKHPRHRKLISINKRHTGRKNREFNLRHDWNSLLTDDFSLLFTNYSKAYFPQADCLMKYLKDFSEKFKLKIKLDTKISDIAYNKNVANERCRFTMKDQMGSSICCKGLKNSKRYETMKKLINFYNSMVAGYDQNIEEYSMAKLRKIEELQTLMTRMRYLNKAMPAMKPSAIRTLFVATGLSVPNRPMGFGDLQFVEHYDTVSVEPEDYEGQSVLIIGNGNSGLEMAASIYGSTNFVHITSKSRIKLSWETHYVGDIRGVNNEVIDSYMLKSLDGFFEVNMNNLQIKKRTDGSNKLDILPPDGSWKGNFAERVPTREGYDRIIACTGFKWDKSIFSQKSPISDSKLKVKDYWKPIKKRVYQTKVSDKYPLINYDYQSADYPGLYFLGTVSHSLDFRKSAGGFIHGFRYSVRALHKILEYRNHGIRWPSKIRKIDQLVSSILNRANEASGLYQMFGHLCDIVIVHKTNKIFTYLEEYPVHLLPHILKYTGHEFDPEKHRIFILTLEYGKKFSEPGADHFSRNRAVLDNPANESNFLHPIIYFFDNRLPTDQQFAEKSMDDSIPKPNDVHHVYEDFTTIFDGPNIHIKPLRRFVEKCLDLDLKMHLADDCVAEDMASGSRAPTCERFFESDEPSVNSYAAN